MNLDSMLNELLQAEGGYSNDPVDPGGETNHGVTIAVARAFGYHGDMRAMSVEQAKEIYRQRYWIAPRFDAVGQQSDSIAAELFDTGVNMGTGVAGKFLQRALNVLNQGGRFYPDIEADGRIGNMTLSALRAFLDKRGPEGEMTLLRMLNAQQSVRYIEIAEKRPTSERFSYGWQSQRVS